jgi:hypothetical protein
MELSFIATDTGCGAARPGNPVTISRISRGRKPVVLYPPFELCALFQAVTLY